MSKATTKGRVSVAEVIGRYGSCLELVSMDPHFHDISVALFVKDGICTVWTYSLKPDVDVRIRQIRDQLVALGGLLGVDGTDNQVSFPCGGSNQSLQQQYQPLAKRCCALRLYWYGGWHRL